MGRKLISNRSSIGMDDMKFLEVAILTLPKPDLELAGAGQD